MWFDILKIFFSPTKRQKIRIEEARSAIGINPYEGDDDLRDAVAAQLHYIVGDLCKEEGFDAETTKMLRIIFERAHFSGVRAEPIGKQIVGLFDGDRKKSLNFALTVLRRANAAMERIRMQRTGIKRYIWCSVCDERTCSICRKRNGKKFYWDKPPKGGHPGEMKGCRCTAEPDFDHFLNS